MVAASDPYPIIPDPPFVVPPGGSRDVVPLPEMAGSKTTLFRADGSLFGEQISDEKGRPVETTFYDDAGRPTLIIDRLPCRSFGANRAV